MQERLRFKDFSQERPRPSGLDAICKLRHFALLTYTVDPQPLTELIHKRFKPDTVLIEGRVKALLSIVPFRVENFTSNEEEQQNPHSVLAGPGNGFTIYLPPKVIE